MLNPAISVIVYLTEMLISYIFFSNIFDKRLSSGKCLIIGCILFGAASLVNLLSDNNALINLIATVLINTLFAFACFVCKKRLALFYSFVLIAICAVWEYVIISSVTVLTDSHFFDYNSSITLFILECPISKILYFFTTLILSRMVTPNERATKLPINLLLYLFTTSACLIIFWYTAAQAGISDTVLKLLATASFVLLVSTVLLFVTYQHQVEKDNEAMQMKSEFTRLQTEKSYYRILEQQNQQLMIYAHDAKNHLAAIQSLNTDPQISGYVSKLSQQLADYTRNCHSGNKLLDVMIHKFSVDCKMKGIHFEYDVKLCGLNEVEDTDLVAILGNLTDNAIAAAEKSEEKRVSLATARQNSYSVIIISNSCDTPPKCSGTHLVTSKADQNMHGFGLKSVSKTLKKYEGDFEWEYDDCKRTFTVTVMIGNLLDKSHV